MNFHPSQVLTLKSCSFWSVAVLGAFLAIAMGSNQVTHAQMPAAPITSSGLNTQVSAPVSIPGGKTQYNITGGSRPGNGPNLFHSFGDFGVPTTNIANFLNDSGLFTRDILGRVTGGNPSNIFGTIRTTDFGNANLYLINPAGVVFGPNATLDIGSSLGTPGSFHVSTADYIRFNDPSQLGVNKPRFYADPARTSILTSFSPDAFGFLNPNPAAIAIQGSTLQVGEGQILSVVGGNITMTGGELLAPSGQINLVSVASPGEVLSSNYQFGPNVNGESFTSLGNIMISQDARIDTAGATDGTVVVHGGQLTIEDGATIASAASSNLSASAGSVTISGAGVQMTGSDVTINGTDVSVTGSKVTAAHLDGSGGTITITAGSVDRPGNVTVSQDALLNASGTRGGSVIIRGGQLIIDDATISADTVNTNGATTAIDINLTGDLSITNATVPAITARTSGSGDAGDIVITSGSVNVASTTFDILPVIDTHTTGTGKAGNVSITTGDLKITGDPVGLAFFIDSGTEGPGHGGDGTITARSVQMDNTFVSTGNFIANLLGEDATGSAGKVAISADSLKLTFSAIATDAFSFANSTGQAGNITVRASDINLDNSFLSSAGHKRGGAIGINADHLVATDSQIVTQTNLSPGGAVTVTGKVIELSTGSSIVSSTGGDGDAGPINITATDHLGLLRATGTDRPSGIFSNSFGTFGSSGNAGDIVITTPKLEMTGGARINTTTATNGHGGNVTINKNVTTNTTDSISMSGETGGFSPEPLFSLGTIQPSGIFTLTIGGHCSGTCGNAGNVSITTGSLTMGSGAQINSGTSSTGQGGNITINASDTVSISGTLSNGQPAGMLSRTIGTAPGSGNGGKIEFHAPQVEVMNGASVSASSTGTGVAGNILVKASDSLAMQNSSITTESAQSGGGSIEIQAGRMVQLTDSRITTSVHGGGGDAGNITIDPQFVILQNSQVLAQAFGGNGGNILIVTQVCVGCDPSHISASSTFGVSGTVQVQTTVSNLSESVAPLPAEIVQAAQLLQARCAARLAGGTSGSFVVAGRDGLPLEPGGWLPSPLFVESERSTRLAESLGLPALQIGLPFVESSLVLGPLAIGCSS